MPISFPLSLFFLVSDYVDSKAGSVQNPLSVLSDEEKGKSPILVPVQPFFGSIGFFFFFSQDTPSAVILERWCEQK
jgi:hypothetical protein